MKRSSILLSAILLAALGASSAKAQDAPILRTGTWEVGGFLGGSYGIDKARVMGGGNVVYSLTRVIMPYGEFSYFPGIGRQVAVPGIAGARAIFSIPLNDFNFGVHIRVPIPKSRVIPYGVLGWGGIRSPARTVNFRAPDPFRPGQTVDTPLPVDASTDTALNFGVGLRYYATERLGFRGEFKAYRPSGQFNDFFYRAAGGFFIQF